MASPLVVPSEIKPAPTAAWLAAGPLILPHESKIDNQRPVLGEPDTEPTILDTGTYDFAYATGLVFDGPETRAANGGSPLKLYAGSPTHSSLASDVMFPSPAVGFACDDWSTHTRAVVTGRRCAIIPLGLHIAA